MPTKNFIKLFLFGCILYTLKISAIGQNKEDTSFAKTIFWSISGNGLNDTSYILGTAHPIFKEDIRFADTVLHALAKAQSVYFENIPSTNADSEARVNHIMDKPRLKSLLGEICYDSVIVFLKKFADTILYDPMFLYFTPQYLHNRLISDAFGGNITAIDSYLLAIAIGNEQPVYALDKPGIEKMIYDASPLNMQATSLYYILQNFKRALQNFYSSTKEFANWYNKGDIASIYLKANYIRLNIGSGLYTIRPPIEFLLDDRNKAWVPEIEEACKSKKCFFAFGAAHLAGRQGVLALLMRKGYSIIPIMLNN